jgi:hypothetical protein
MKRSTASALIVALALACASYAGASNPYGARHGAVPDRSPPIANDDIATTSSDAPAALNVASLNEGFDDITTLVANGWVLQNNSTPVGSTSWTQGPAVSGGGPFDAFDGASNAFISANYNNTGNTGTISNWMLTPVLDFGGGANLTFYTRKVSPDSYADRLEVRISTNGDSTDIGVPGTGVGDFTTLALSINPTLVLGVYPTSWTQFTISGLPHNGTGRIAFRYYVTNAGYLGTNSDFIGIDHVTYAGGTPEYHVGGNVSGLAGTGLVLQLNGANDLTVGADGSFVFPPYVVDGGTYTVTVASQPSNLNQTCTVSNDNGTIAGADIANVQVTCTTNTYAIGGSVSGLSGTGLLLHLDNGDDFAVTANGSFEFPTALGDGSGYVASITTQPSTLSQTCSIVNPSGTVAGSDVGDIAVTCVTNTYHVGGVVSGLAGTGLVLHLDNGDDVAVPVNGSFAFPTALTDGSPYVVSVGTQPGNPGQTCSVANGSGALAGQDVTNVAVSCVTNTYHVGGSVSGLDGSGLVLHLGSGADLPVAANGSFIFPAALDDGSAYAVSVGTQPTSPTQTCIVTNGSGKLAGHDVTNITVSCTTNTYLIGGTVSGLKGSGLVLHLDSGENLPVAAGDGSFLFVTARNDGSSYLVTVGTQPDEPRQTCLVANASGTLSGHDVTNIAVTCTTNTYAIGGNVTGIDGFDVVLQLNGENDLTVVSDGAFTFPTRLPDGSTFAVTVLSPSGVCLVQNGSGVVTGSAVLTVLVACDLLFRDGFELP